MPPKVRSRDESIRYFLDRVEVREDGCWQWTGTMKPNGYGSAYFHPDALRPGSRPWTSHSFGSTHNAHRVAYLLFVDTVPDGLVIDHLCRNRSCVNPDHLEAVTQTVNIRRGHAARRPVAS